MSSQPDVNDVRQWEKIDALCENMGKVQSDIAYIKGKLDGGFSKTETGYNVASKQNAITLALAGLITTIGTILGRVTGGN